MDFDLLVFIGRFQPFHNGHLAVIDEALRRARQVLVLVGSALRPRSVRDPFSAAERIAMIREALPPEARQRVTLTALEDALYNDAAWIRNVHRATFECIAAVYPGRTEDDLRIGLVGHGKDKSSYYLKLFPTWGAVDVANHAGLCATDLRAAWLAAAADATPEALAPRVPPAVRERLAAFARTPAFAELQAEQDYVARYRAKFAGLPYPPTFVTADALVLQSGHLLVVRRDGRPGRGLLALPGGFIDGNETAFDAALRELAEETGLAVPQSILRGALNARDFFDEPHRSARGRTITFAFRFDLHGDGELPAVRRGDDAREAFWLPLAKVRPEEFFEDHYFILRKMVGL